MSLGCQVFLDVLGVLDVLVYLDGLDGLEQRVTYRLSEKTNLMVWVCVHENETQKSKCVV